MFVFSAIWQRPELSRYVQQPAVHHRIMTRAELDSRKNVRAFFRLKADSRVRALTPKRIKNPEPERRKIEFRPPVPSSLLSLSRCQESHNAAARCIFP